MVIFLFLDLGMDEDDDEPVPLPNVNGAIMKKVMYILSCLELTYMYLCVIVISNAQ